MLAEQAEKAGGARRIVEKFIATELYPTDTPDFAVEVITVFTHEDKWWVYLDSTLPDDMLYRVEWDAIPNSVPEITAYAKWDAS